VSEIKSLGGKVTDTEVIEKLFSSVTEKFTNIIETIEQFSDITKMTVPELSADCGHTKRIIRGGKRLRTMVRSCCTLMLIWKLELQKSRRSLKVPAARNSTAAMAEKAADRIVRKVQVGAKVIASSTKGGHAIMTNQK
jgi:hypothetical protein